MENIMVLRAFSLPVKYAEVGGVFRCAINEVAF